jgi:sphingomyelin phosphodiesterase acid-like 3
MKHRNFAHFAGIIATRPIALLSLILMTGACFAQSGKPAAPPAQAAASALLLSDIHFEPFWDPAKLPQLIAAPVSGWEAILSAAPSADQAQRFAALQQGCHARGADTSYALYDSSLKAMRSRAAGASFVTVSGDLISHAFDCKFKALAPNSTPEEYRAFVEKTLDYVIDELYQSFPNTPVYIAMGNNDSDCGDYRLDAGGEFLAAIGKEVTKNFAPKERQAAEASFSAGGYYSVLLPAAIRNARLLVLDDIFMSKNYATCSGKPDASAADAQVTWLRQQLAEARAAGQKVWVMGHIPPGVDLHATVSKRVDVCGGQEPKMFLSSEKLADALTDSADVVELAVFAHTHMDEMKLLKGEAQPAAPDQPERAGRNGSAETNAVAVKMAPSISPINGNHPSFTVAQVDPSSAALRDYQVFTASNPSGEAIAWTEEYDFDRSYHQAEFNSSTVSRLIAEFESDPGAKSEVSQSYLQDFSAGSSSPLLQIFWPEYVCSLSNHTRQSFRDCLCPAAR